MPLHPIEAVLVNAVTVNKATLREELKQNVRDFGSVANFRTYDLPNVPKAVINNSLYYFDATDFISADNGNSVVWDVMARRFKKVTLAVAGETLFRQTAIAGSANALAITSNGLASLSATPQLILITPAANNTLAATIAYDGGAVLPLLSNIGNPLAADELIARPTLVSATSTDTRIITPW